MRVKIFILFFGLIACTSLADNLVQPTQKTTVELILANHPTATIQIKTPKAPTSTPDSSSIIVFTATPGLEVCSPLQDVPLAELPNRIVNPFSPPPAGSDDPHMGIDLAEVFPGTDIAKSGLPVHAVLPGKIAMVLQDRFPYGNAINPHLHLEVRVGPSNVRIPGMAHYTNDATLQEMAWYCSWRVSGWFQLLDPMQILVTP